MSQPPAYSRAFSFTNQQAANPSAPLPGTQVDLELNNAKRTLDAVLANLALIQRDDGAIKNASVGYDQLKTEIVLGFNAPSVWITATAYTANSSTVFNGSGFYRCLVTHTSGVFATDLAALKWQLIVNLATVPLVSASQIAVTPSGLLTTNAQTSLQALDTGKAALSHNQTAATISDSTAAGRALLTAADAAAQNVLLGISTLAFTPGDIKETACPVLATGWYYCDGSAKNRVTDVNLFNAITIQQSGTIFTSGVITGLSDTSNMSPGMPISGTGVQALTVIQSVDSGTQITLTLACSFSALVTVAVCPHGVGDGSTTFNLPNRAGYVAVGRDNASGSAQNNSQLSTTISATSGSATASVTSATGLFVGMFINNPKVPLGTTILTISGTTITMSANATGTTVSAVRFSALLDAQTIGSTGGAPSQAVTLVAANLPSVTSVNAAQAISVTSVGHTVPQDSTTVLFGTGGVDRGMYWPGGTATIGTLTSSGNNSITVTSSGTTSTPFRTETFQPTVVMNFIVKR